MKNKIIISLFIIVILVNVIGGVYFIFFHDKKEEEENWVMKQVKKGNLYASIEVSDDISKLNFKQGDIVDVYMYGNDITDEMSKTPLLKNALVAYDYDKSTSGLLGLLIPEDMHFITKCANIMVSHEGYILKVKKSNSNIETEIKINNDIKKVIDNHCQQVEVEVELGDYTI